MIKDSALHQGMRKKLVEEIEKKGITDKFVLEAIGKVPRHLFMESGFLNFAYRDQAFPIGAGQTISQPFTVAYQSQLLKVSPNDKILEIGTGSGYQAAVLIELGAMVFTIERQRELFLKVQQFLPSIGYNPRFFFGDGYKGLPSYGPFDGIVVTAAAPYIPEELKNQLKTGGRLVIPVNSEFHQIMTVVTRKSETEFDERHYGNFSFVPMLKGTSESM